MISPFPKAPERSTGTTPAPITSPSSDVTPTTICMKCFLAAASTRLQNESLRGGKRGKRRSQNTRRRGALVFHIRGAAGEKKTAWKQRIRCRILKAEKERVRKKKKQILFSCIGKWSYPPRESTSLRWRASRRSAAERFVTRALKDIFTHMHMERSITSLPPSLTFYVFCFSFHHFSKMTAMAMQSALCCVK